MDVIRAEIKKSNDLMARDLQEGLLGLSVMRGIELPEAGTWRAQRERAKERAFDYWENPSREDDGSWVDGALDELGGGSGGAIPLRREAPKVGRNDPCPCGSGKKYKKCCGKAEE